MMNYSSNISKLSTTKAKAEGNFTSPIWWKGKCYL